MYTHVYDREDTIRVAEADLKSAEQVCLCVCVCLFALHTHDCEDIELKAEADLKAAQQVRLCMYVSGYVCVCTLTYPNIGKIDVCTCITWVCIHEQ